MAAEGSIQLPATMQAVVCHAPEDYRLEEMPVPTPGPGEVVVRVAAVGICASDLKCYHGAPLFWGDKHRAGFCQPPIIPGHEFVGHVVALGEGGREQLTELLSRLDELLSAGTDTGNGNGENQD